MKEENFLRRRFSLCPASSTPQKVDPRKLTRNLFFGADNDIYPLSPGWLFFIAMALSGNRGHENWGLYLFECCMALHLKNVFSGTSLRGIWCVSP